MSLTTHKPGEPCIGHCGACGAYGEWSDIISGLLEALTTVRDTLGPEDSLWSVAGAALDKAERQRNGPSH